MHFSVALVDETTPPGTGAVISESIDVDWGNHEVEHSDDPEGYVLKEFTRRAAAIPADRPMSVWITWFLDEGQGDIHFPPAFMKLVAERNWPVHLGLND